MSVPMAREEHHFLRSDVAVRERPRRLAVRSPHDLAMRDLQVRQLREAAASDDRDHAVLRELCGQKALETPMNADERRCITSMGMCFLRLCIQCHEIPGISNGPSAKVSAFIGVHRRFQSLSLSKHKWKEGC